MKIVVGLGNPGKEYALTRHNLGFKVLDKFAAIHSLPFAREKLKSQIATGTVAGEKVLLAKPQTFMNSSGDAVGALVRFYKSLPSDLLVLYDDIDLSFGSIRLRASGGSGGHKGMKSIISNLSSDEFPRLRLGIRGSTPIGDLSNYVLKPFSSEEQSDLGEILQSACDIVEAVLTNPLEKVMSQFNSRG